MYFEFNNRFTTSASGPLGLETPSALLNRPFHFDAMDMRFHKSSPSESLFPLIDSSIKLTSTSDSARRGKGMLLFDLTGKNLSGIIDDIRRNSTGPFLNVGSPPDKLSIPSRSAS
jgi:hypothetical protein